MKIENYKTAMSEVRISEKKYSELCEMIADPDISDTVDIVIENKFAKKKIKRIGTPAIIAAAVLLTVGGTVFAAELSGNSILKVYFRGVTEKYDISEVPIIDDVESVFTEVTVSDLAGKESVRFVSAVCDKYNFFATFEYVADESVLTDDIPEDAVFGFEESYVLVGGTYGTECISHTDNRFSFVYHIGGIGSLPKDKLGFYLGRFGYYSDDGFIRRFIPLSTERLHLTIPIEEIKVQQSIKANNSVQVDGITFEVELSPLGLLLYADHNALENWRIENNTNDKYLIRLNHFIFYMKDGSDFGDRTVYGLIRSQTGWIDLEEGKEYNSYGFSVPVDISEIDHISFHGEDFYFDVPQE